MLVYKKAEDIPVFPKVELRSVSSRGSYAFEYGENIELAVTLPREILPSALSVWVYSDDNKTYTSYLLSLSDEDRTDVTFKGSLDTVTLCGDEKSGLFYFTFCVQCVYGEVFISDMGYKGYRLVSEKSLASACQVTVYQKGTAAPKFIKGGVMYHIFVDRFAKGIRPVPKREDAVYADWGSPITQYGEKAGDHVENNLFYGGDLWGATEKLPYLSSLGVTCIYLSPVFSAYSNHKYDTADYTRVDGSFGGDEALKCFVTEAQKLGISVILDGVFNHTGYYSRYFNTLGQYSRKGAYESKRSPYYSWYTFEEYPHKYRCWWGVKILPCVKSDEPSYLDYICGKEGIAERWMDIGVKGFRLDVADELSDTFLDRFRKAVKGKDSDAYIVGEVWEDASNKVAYGRRRRYFRGQQLDSVMNYPLKDAIIYYLKTGDAHILASTLFWIYRNYPPFARNSLMNILGTHDTERILTVLGGSPAGERSNSVLSTARMTVAEREKGKALLKIAYLILAFVPGVPCIFYGDEAGIEGYGDPFNRLCYPWGEEDSELIGYYRKIGKIRRDTPFLKDAELHLLRWDGGCFSFARQDNEKGLTVCVNMSDRSQRFYVGQRWSSPLTSEIGDCFAELKPKSADIFLSDI